MGIFLIFSSCAVFVLLRAASLAFARLGEVSESNENNERALFELRGEPRQPSAESTNQSTFFTTFRLFCFRQTHSPRRAVCLGFQCSACGEAACRDHASSRPT